MQKCMTMPDAFGSWDDLRFFLAVARAGTLAAAARMLAVDQSTVGRRISILERRLGATLFARSPAGFVLSEAGHQMLPRVEIVERSMHEFERGATGEDQRLAGVVRVATSVAFANTFLMRHLAALHARHPEMIVELTLGAPQVNLLKREADLAVRLGSRGQDDLLARKLGAVGWSVYASPRYLAQRGRPRVREAFVGHDVVGFNGDLAGCPGARWLAEHAGAARVAARCNDLVTAVRAAEAGFGLAIVPNIVGHEAAAERVLANVIMVDAWLVMHKQVQKSARVRAVADFVVELCQRERERLSG